MFYQWFRAIQNHSTEFGRSLHIKRDRAGNTISYKISFSHLGTFKYHIGEIIERKDNIKIRKENKVTGELAKVAISEEKPAKIVYQIKKGQVSFQLKYEGFNKYKQLCRFSISGSYNLVISIYRVIYEVIQIVKHFLLLF